MISDPGFDLLRGAIEEGHPATAAPGAAAVIMALTVAGLPTDRFLFAGFLPNASGARKKTLTELAGVLATLAFYESPKRIAGMLGDAAEVLGGDRKAVVCRELTKKFEEARRGTLSELASYYGENTAKGEIVVLIDRGHSENISESDVTTALEEALKTMSVRDASDFVAKMLGQPRRPIYQQAMKMRNDDHS